MVLQNCPSSVELCFPAENSNSETIVITGKRANCEAARSRILSIQKDLVRGGGGQASSLPPVPGTGKPTLSFSLGVF